LCDAVLRADLKGVAAEFRLPRLAVEGRSKQGGRLKGGGKGKKRARKDGDSDGGDSDGGDDDEEEQRVRAARSTVGQLREYNLRYDSGISVIWRLHGPTVERMQMSLSEGGDSRPGTSCAFVFPNSEAFQNPLGTHHTHRFPFVWLVRTASRSEGVVQLYGVAT
jgi:hypothetical protein